MNTARFGETGKRILCAALSAFLMISPAGTVRAAEDTAAASHAEAEKDASAASPLLLPKPPDTVYTNAHETEPV